MSSKPALVLVTASNCNGCMYFKKYWPKIESKVKNLVRVIPIEVPTMRDKIMKPYPSALNKIAGSIYPMLILISAEEWDRALYDPDIPSFKNFSVMDAEIKNGHIFPLSTEVPSEENVIRWVQEKVIGSSSNIQPSVTGSTSSGGNYAICGIHYVPARRR